jgi:hypothetical protein
MNERIKQLAEQAITERLSIDEYIEALKKEPNDFYGFRVSELQKFAELIEGEAEKKYFSAGYIAGRSDGIIETVQECAAYVKNSNCFTYASQADLCAERMTQHFGVSE